MYLGFALGQTALVLMIARFAQLLVVTPSEERTPDPIGTVVKGSPYQYPVTERRQVEVPRVVAWRCQWSTAVVSESINSE